MLKIKNADVGQPVSPPINESSQRGSPWSIYLPHLLIVIVITVGILLRLSDYPLSWFDEGYTTHVAHLLVEKGVYGTYNGLRLSPYDPFVSSGPGVVLPIAVSFKLFGEGVEQGRLALFPYSLLLGLSLFYLARYLYGQMMAFLTVLGVLVIFQWLVNIANLDLSPLMLGRQVLGEVPAISMILLGLLIWFKSWDRHSWQLTVLAGVICGIGVLSKMQTAFGLAPALFIIAAFRSFKNRRYIFLYFLPLCLVVLSVITWMSFQRLSAPAELRPEYSNITTLAIMVHYIIGLFGRVLERRVVLISAVIAIFIGLRLALLAWQSRKEKEVEITNRQWAELTIIAFALFYLIWYFDLSVGWERYLFPAFILTCLFASKLGWDVITRLFYKPEHKWVKQLQQGNINFYMIAVATVSVVLIAMSILVWDDPDVNGAKQVTDFIRTNIPQQALIESWEWELDSPSDHLNVHHPDSVYVIASIWDLAMHQPIVFDYDMLQANPDYLILGRFNNLTGIYNWEEVDKHFELIEDFGLYHIYKRK